MDLRSRKRAETRLQQYFSHKHPLLFIQHHSFALEDDDDDACFVCGKLVDGPSYGCHECKCYLHERCAELKFSPMINHPLHPQHLLILSRNSPRKGHCNLCSRSFLGFVYYCPPCNFNLHINCALLQSSIAATFPASLHQHRMFFIQNHDDQVKYDCSGCEKPLSGPIYHCSDCSYPKFFNLHKKCAELPLEINHPYDRKHPLALLPRRDAHPDQCSCYLCKIRWGGFVYSCSLCNFELSLDDFSSPRTITDSSHDHPWTLLSRRMSFVCDFCGTAGDHTPYLCTTCDLLVHRNCISLPRNIMITRHPHAISLSYSLQQNRVEEWMCRICYKEVDIRYGSYCCSASDCHYVAHVYCATDDAIWDGTILMEADVKRSREVLHRSSNLITDVVERVSIGEVMVASEIKHSYHDHHLTLTFSGETEGGNQCDGCMRPISTPFYSCDRCEFFLHKDCAELPREKGHPFHKHLLTLTYSPDGISICKACHRHYHGFSYRCYKNDCGPSNYDINFDIQCMLLSDTMTHPNHGHSLFLAQNYRANCSGCLSTVNTWNMAYRCMKHCDFTLDIRCATLPLTAWYKCDKHPLTLTYSDDSDPCQCYCDLCENERQPEHWFYHCANCDSSLHSTCAIGDLPLMKLGSNIEDHFNRHQHPLTVVKNTWNCPPCKVCKELCNGQAVECRRAECNFTVHWKCSLSSYLS
ncbi:hypothetical protein GQ457_01G034700 [Hibiscus cannabinus]